MKKHQVLLSFDIDGTLLGQPEHEARFKDWAEARPKAIALAYASGRGIASMRSEVASGRLPQPDLFIGHLGTVIEWPEGPALDLMSALFGNVHPAWNAARVYELGQGEGLRLQEPEHNNAYKASFYWSGDHQHLLAFHRRLESGLGREVWRSMAVQGMYIDIMPHNVGKAGATLVAAQALGLKPEDVIVAGDSENDQDLFIEPGFRCILPSNACDLLRRLAPDAYQSQHAEAAGVLEGLKHFGIL